MKYWIQTFGCQMNKSDSERISKVLERKNYKPTSKISEADLTVVNMCSVRQSAVDRVHGLLLKFKKQKAKKPKLKTLLTGCILKKDKIKFKNHFDYILSIKSLSLWPKFLEQPQHYYCPALRSKTFNEKFKADYLKTKPNFQTDPTAFVPISTGCNNFCAYCVVPKTRGPETCRPASNILKEIRNLVIKKHKEIWLLGQNVNSYQSPIKPLLDFPGLIKKVNKIKGNFWLRFTSPHPKDFSERLIDTMANSEKATEYLNLPVQSGDDQVLKKMKRNYTVKYYKNLVKKVRKKIPEITLSTDVIVGFPGETKSQFENTAQLFSDVGFDMAYIAKYSPRPGTEASKMEDNVTTEEKNRREKALTEILKKTSLQRNKKYINRKVKVLVEEQKSPNLWTGKTRTHKNVQFKSEKNLKGQFVKTKIIKASPWGLKAELIN